MTGGHLLLYLCCTVHCLQVRWLEGMATVDQKLKLTVRRLKDRLEQLDKDIGEEGLLNASGKCFFLASVSKTMFKFGYQLMV